MKNVSKFIILCASIPLILSACEDFEKKSYCLETSSQPEYQEGMCYQASRDDILESIHLINLKDPDTNKYDIEWKGNISVNNFTFTEGLIGKKVKSVLTLDENVIRLIIYGKVEDNEATSGYIKVDPDAFKAKREATKEAYLYAYVALGESSGMVKKPEIEQE